MDAVSNQFRVWERPAKVVRNISIRFLHLRKIEETRHKLIIENARDFLPIISCCCVTNTKEYAKQVVRPSVAFLEQKKENTVLNSKNSPALIRVTPACRAPIELDTKDEYTRPRALLTSLERGKQKKNRPYPSKKAFKRPLTLCAIESSKIRRHLVVVGNVGVAEDLFALFLLFVFFLLRGRFDSRAIGRSVGEVLMYKLDGKPNKLGLRGNVVGRHCFFCSLPQFHSAHQRSRSRS